MPRRPKPTLLFLGCYPPGEDPPDMSREYTRVNSELRQSGFQVGSDWRVVTNAIHWCFIEHEPHVLHVSGHGEQYGLVFEGADANPEPADLRGIAEMFSECVSIAVFNACVTPAQAEILAEYVDVVISMADPLTDERALRFARAFYEYLVQHESVARAVELAQRNVWRDASDNPRRPRVHARSGVDPDEVFLDISPRRSRPPNHDAATNPDAN